MKVYNAQITEHNNWSFVEENIMKIDHKGIFISFCDTYFVNDPPPVTDVWYGIVHNPIGWEKYSPWDVNTSLFEVESFLQSLSYCKILFVLAKTQVEPTIELLHSKGFMNVKVISIIHPINEVSYCKFDFDKYVVNKNKQIYSVGNWLRKQYTIFQLKCSNKFNKCIMPFNQRTKLELAFYFKLFHVELTSEEVCSVKKLKYVEVDDYKKLFEDNLIFLDVYLTTINNTFLESIISNTPIILNRKQEYMDLIGNNYPLFFDDINDINSFIEDDANILNAHNYLKNIDKTKFGIDFFITTLKEHLNNSD